MIRDRVLSMFPYILVLSAGMMWGLTFSLARMATEHHAHPVGLAFWQAFGGGVLLLVICILRRLRPTFDGQSLKHYCVIAMLGTAIPATMYFYAVPRVPVGVLAITVALVPMLTYAFSWVMGIDRFKPGRFLGVILGFIAIIILVAPDSSLPDPGMVKWLLLALGATLFYTCENVYVDHWVPRQTNMIVLLMGALIIAGIVLIPVIIMMDAFVPISLPLDRSEWAILAMMIVSSLAYLMFFYVIKMSGAVFASITGYVITLCGVFWGVFLFDEQHSPWVWASLALMLSGMTLVTPRKAT